VRTTKPVNRLFRIADDKQLAGNRSDAVPVALGGTVGAQQEQEFGLERIGVLKLVDEDVRESRLKRLAYAGVLDEEIARPQKQVDEIQGPGGALQIVIAANNVPELFVKPRGQIAVGSALKDVELPGQRFEGR